MSDRQITFGQAILEATDQCMAADPSVYVMGLGVTDPKGIFGTTAGLEAKYGSRRVLDMPTSENGMTGVAIGSSLVGSKPVMVHQRIDFGLLALDQIVNNAANWHYMFGGEGHVPVVLRFIVGRGWGQGAQHAQSLQAMFAHVPGLKVVMPSTAHDAKGLLAAAIADPNPVVYIEHRWLHSLHGPVPEELFTVPIGKARVLRSGSDVTIASTSYMSVEAFRAAEVLARFNVDAEVIDLRSLKPLDTDTLCESVARTGRLVVADGAWRTGGFAGEIITAVVERAWDSLKAAPVRVTFPDAPVPSSAALSGLYYPKAIDILNAAHRTLGVAPISAEQAGLVSELPPDVPDPAFKGPF